MDVKGFVNTKRNARAARRINLSPTYREWLNRATLEAGSDWLYLSEMYSFAAAYNDGLTPEAAVEDAREWLGW